MKKVLIFILIFYLLTLIQTSFFFHFNLFGVTPNLVFILVILFNFLEKKEKSDGLIIATVGGFCLDLFSFLSLGISIFLLFFIAFLIKKFLKPLIEENIIHFAFVLLGSFVFYSIFSILINSLLDFSLPHFFVWNKLIVVELFYNLLVGLIFYLIFLCSKRILER